MKSNSKLLTVAGFGLGLCALIWSGCNQQTPSAVSLAGPTVDQYSLLNITNSTYTVNTHILGNPSSNFKNIVSWSTSVTFCSGPADLVPFTFKLYNPGGITGYNTQPIPTPTGQGVIYLPTPGATPCEGLATVGYSIFEVPTGLTDSYDQYAVSVTGLINDSENPLYPPGGGNGDSLSLEVFPAGLNAFYNVSVYQGIEFYIYVSSQDTVTDRVFLANVEQQIPTNQNPPGTCVGTTLSPDPSLTHCFDGFEFDYTNTPKDQWVLVQKNWGDLKQYGFGSITSPPTFTGTNLQQLGYFQWVEGNSTFAGPETVNFSIAGVRFF